MKSLAAKPHALLATALLLISSTPLIAQQDFSKVEIKTTALTESVYMLTGAGGNIGVSIGEDGTFIIDDQFAPLSDKIMTALNALSDQPIRYVLNTHWHGDHTGGNENFGKTGAVIVAHDNVRQRMSTEQFMKAFGREVPASPDTALPVVTFSDNVTFHFNSDELKVMHQPAAHTDGDSFLLFSNANVLHMGDTFFNGFFPFIDESSGGSLDGIIAASETALGLVNDETQIIPGHGALASKTELQSYLNMLNEVKSLMAPHIKSGKSREDVVTANPLEPLSEQWGGGFMNTETFTGIVFDVESDG